MSSAVGSVLFVCMGNICRSPSAEGVVRKLAEDAGLQLEFDSAGTHAYHVGEPPDPRAVAAADARGIDISMQRARAVEIADFHQFDLILAMDNDNLELLRKIQPRESAAQLRLLLSYCEARVESEVPDPYYGGDQGFEHVLDLLDDAGRELLRQIAAR